MAPQQTGAPRTLRGLFYWVWKRLNDLSGQYMAQLNPVMRGDMQGGGYDINNVKTLEIVGEPSYGDGSYQFGYTPTFIKVDADHIWNYTNYDFIGFKGITLPPVVSFTGEQLLQVPMFFLGGGIMFANAPTFINDTAYPLVTFNGIVTLSAGPSFRADTAAVSMIGNGIDLWSLPLYDSVNGGSIVGASFTHFVINSNMRIGDGVALGNRKPIYVGDITKLGAGTGTLSKQAGVVVDELLLATDNTNLLLGTNTVPAGNWNVYQAGTKPNRWSSGQLFKIRTITGTAAVLTVVENYVIMSTGAAATCTLPSAVGLTGWMVTIKKTGATGTISIKSVLNQTADGVNITTGSIPLATQYHVVTLISDGANWHVLKTGAP